MRSRKEAERGIPDHLVQGTCPDPLPKLSLPNRPSQIALPNCPRIKTCNKPFPISHRPINNLMSHASCPQLASLRILVIALGSYLYTFVSSHFTDVFPEKIEDNSPCAKIFHLTRAHSRAPTSRGVNHLTASMVETLAKWFHSSRYLTTATEKVISSMDMTVRLTST